VTAARPLLSDSVWYVRAHAARAIGEAGNPEFAGDIAPLLADREWWVRTAAKEALQRMGSEVWSTLVPYLDHTDTFARNGAAEVLQAEPALRDGVVGAVRFPGDASLRPDRYVAGLACALREAGGQVVEHCAVESLDDHHGGVTVRTSLGERRATDVLIATGAWSPRLARALSPSLGLLRGAMQPGKGYSITYARPSLAPRRPLVLHERSVCVTTWEDGYRLGSTMEFSGFDDTLNRRRLDALERGAREYLREPVGPSKREEWFGWRPMTFDDLPIIGRAPGTSHLWLATGHGMLGVSMSVATAGLVTDLVTGRTPRLDPGPFRMERFA